MKYFVFILFTFLFIASDCSAQKRKNKNRTGNTSGIRIMEAAGDSIRRDSVVYYETEIGFVMPDYSAKFIGGWQINVMMRQAMAEPDLLKSAYIRFIDDTSFTAYAGCNTFTGKYNIKGPTIKFTISDSHLRACDTDIEEWLVRLLQERVSYYGIDEKKLYLKDVAYNVVFDCTKE